MAGTHSLTNNNVFGQFFRDTKSNLFFWKTLYFGTFKPKSGPDYDLWNLETESF
jgi:hypothetical protein